MRALTARAPLAGGTGVPTSFCSGKTALCRSGRPSDANRSAVSDRPLLHSGLGAGGGLQRARPPPTGRPASRVFSPDNGDSNCPRQPPQLGAKLRDVTPSEAKMTDEAK